MPDPDKRSGSTGDQSGSTGDRSSSRGGQSGSRRDQDDLDQFEESWRREPSDKRPSGRESEGMGDEANLGDGSSRRRDRTRE